MKVIIDGVKYYPEGKPQPKPLLANAKVGDLCQRRDGKWVQLSDVIGNSVFKYPSPASNDVTFQFICDETGDTKLWGKVDKADIIHTEPLAPEGTAEWAGQMLKLGEKVIHGYNEYAHHLERDGKVYYGNINKDCQGWLQEWVNGRTKQTGWKLYNPKPAKAPEQPFAKVKVGDYLELSNGKPVKVANVTPIANQHDMVIDTLNGKFWGYYWFSGKPICCANPPITRILKPEEVRVKITLEGTVSQCITNGGRDCFSLNLKSRNWHAIDYADLDPATAYLVRDLIAKQEES